MRRNVFFGLLLLFSFGSYLLAQNADKENSVKSTDVDLNVNVIFDKTIDYLQMNDYFIMSLDKQSGFIQAKIIIKKGANYFTRKSDERRTLNFIIRPMTETKSRIILDINIERKTNVDKQNTYDDKGKIAHPDIYIEILNDLQGSFK